MSQMAWMSSEPRTRLEVSPSGAVAYEVSVVLAREVAGHAVFRVHRETLVREGEVAAADIGPGLEALADGGEGLRGGDVGGALGVDLERMPARRPPHADAASIH